MCGAPGICKPPSSALYSTVLPATPRHQWETENGFCGSLAIQTIALTHGVWISEDIIRKNAPPSGGYGNDTEGYEILHTNIEAALTNLGFKHEAFDYKNTPLPQSDTFISWLKSKLAQGQGVVWMIMCKGGDHNMYNIPNATYDHLETVLGIYSNHSLTDTTVYPDDVLLHTS